MTDGRTLLIFEELPKREKLLDRDQIDLDVREAMAKAEAKLRKQAQRYTVTGWLPVGEIDYAHPGPGLISAKLRLER